MQTNALIGGTYGVFFFSVGSEFVPVTVYRDWISWSPIMTVWFDEVGCNGNAYVPKLGDNREFANKLVNDRAYAVLPDNVTITRVNLSPDRQVSGSLMQSYMSFVSAGGGYTKNCVNSSTASTMQPFEVIGTLPDTTPPYSVTVQ
jgi:hypothetical protein